MATIRLVPSSYGSSGTSYISVSNENNMYTNTDSTNYATITNTNASTSSRYLYLRGFNFSSVPSNAVVSSFTVKIKGYESGLATGSSYYPRLCNNTTAISGTTASSTFGTSTQTITIPTGSLTWSDITGYGSNFGILVYVRRNARNTTGYFYCYGAEIEVTYTVPVYHTVTATASSGTIDPSGSVSVLEGEDYTLTISDVIPAVTDNGVDVTSQLTQLTTATQTGIPSSNTNSNFSISNINNAYADATSTTYADLSVSGRATGEIYFSFSGLSIPNGATITSVSCSATLQYSRNNSSSSATASCQMYAGTTAKGSSTSIISSGGTDVAKTTFNLSVGSWTASELANAKFYLTCYNGASSTVRHIYVYGISLNVSFESDDVIYVYTIHNVTADHTISVVAGVTVDATGVSLNKSSTSIEVLQTEQLTATVAPSNASNKSVTWSSSNTSVATVSSGGLVSAVSEGTAVITVTTVDGGFTYTCTVTVTPKPGYVIVIGGYAMSTNTTDDIYVNAAGTYNYYGMDGVEYTDGMYTPQEIIWYFTESGNGYYIQSKDGRYLNATYLSNGNGNDGTVKLDNTPDVWTISGTFNNWKVNGSVLHSTNANKNLTHEEASEYDNTPVNVFTVRTTGETSYVHDENTVLPTVLYVKVSGSWVEVSEAYKKVSGAWVLQADLTTVFDTNINYVRG